MSARRRILVAEPEAVTRRLLMCRLERLGHARLDALERTLRDIESFAAHLAHRARERGERTGP